MTAQPAVVGTRGDLDRTSAVPRVVTDGRFLTVQGAPFTIRGATYGTFRPRADGALYPEPEQVDRDFAAMADAGLNTVRVYTLPPVDVLDTADVHGLRLIVGLSYDDWRMEERPGRQAQRRVAAAGLTEVERAMKRCAGRGTVLAVSVGNEVPGDVVRVHGIGEVEQTLSRLVGAVHEADPGMLATYTNFPTTEYLQVDGQDLATFNVFLEDPAAFRSYLRRLMVVNGDVPLVLTELGLAGEVHGEAAQAAALEWQLQVADETGCAGATVFSWTDEWGVAGESVEGWGFGLTDDDRRSKPALSVVSAWAERRVADLRERWPRVSVVVCAYNEERTIGECLASLEACDYPDLEVVVCDDGSTDRTREIAQGFPFKLLELEHNGLSAARNAGLEAAGGDVVAYLDADAACHPQWPYFLALSLEDEEVVATGGPNLPVERAGLVEHAVAASPGSPQHVLISHDRAEHVPGCNMAYERWALEEIGGFDVAYTSAGDDVDVCWKLLDRGHEIGFAPAAQIRHHRRGTVRGYLKQQRGYGRAERMLQGPHPQRFNRLGQARWIGAIYGGSLSRLLRPVIYHGELGSAPFQGVVRHRGEVTLARLGVLLPLVLPLLVLAGVGALGVPAVGLALGGVTVAIMVGYATAVAAVAEVPRTEPRRLRFRALVGLLHVLQPFVRMWGRTTRYARGGAAAPASPPGERARWTGDRDAWLSRLWTELEGRGLCVRSGGPHRRWDLETSAGPLWQARLTTAVTWKWVPHHHVAVRPRVHLMWVAAATAAAALLSVAALAVVGGLSLVWILAEAGVVLRRTRRAVDATLVGAEA